MKKETTIGWFLIAGAAGVLIPYTSLTINFEYPVILRQDTGTILKRFHEGGASLILTWFAFALTGLPLVPAYLLIGQHSGKNSDLLRIATKFGLIGLIVQMIGLLRWTFVVPVLADNFVVAQDEATRSAVIIAFRTIHQFAGVLLGKHLGQLFTITWTLLVSVHLLRVKIFPGWVALFGIFCSGIYLVAQAELFATVIPGFPVWKPAGLIGSTLWLIWLIILGILFLRKK